MVTYTTQAQLDTPEWFALQVRLAADAAWRERGLWGRLRWIVLGR